LIFRHSLNSGGEQTVRRITESTGFFTADEVNIAEELAREHLEKGAEGSGYYFAAALTDGEIVGYSCYGLIPCSDYSYDLYWIVTDAKHRGKGFGKRLLRETERLIAASGGKNVYAETSSTPLYAPTRAFYEHGGYIKEAVLKDFYRPGDDKVFYSKKLA